MKKFMLTTRSKNKGFEIIEIEKSSFDDAVSEARKIIKANVNIESVEVKNVKFKLTIDRILV